MDWSNERYVRLYTRDTPEWLCMEWQGRALWPLLIRKVDRSGVLANKLGARGVAVLVGLPVEVVEVGLANLLADGCLAEHHLGFVVPNFIEAQETPQSNSQRKRESREHRRVVTKRDIGSRNVTESHAESRDVTSGHAVSQSVTPSQTSPVRTVPEDLSPSRAIPPSAEPVVATTLELRQAARVLIWRELGESRDRAAAQLGIKAQPLMAFDPGERALSGQLAAARTTVELESVVEQARHVIAVAEAEATRDDNRSVQWLTGVIFEERNWRTAAGKSLDDAKRIRAGPSRRGDREQPSHLTTIRKVPQL